MSETIKHSPEVAQAHSKVVMAWDMASYRGLTVDRIKDILAAHLEYAKVTGNPKQRPDLDLALLEPAQDLTTPEGKTAAIAWLQVHRAQDKQSARKLKERAKGNPDQHMLRLLALAENGRANLCFKAEKILQG